jgi:hypothetical protein
MAIVKLAEVCEKIGSGATPRGGKEAYCDEGISLVRSQNVLDFNFSKEGLAFINDEQAKKLSNVEVHSGDVLLNITGDSVARACLMDDDYLPARVNQHVAIIRGNSHKIMNGYVLYYLQWRKEYLLQLASAGATRNALTKAMIEQLELDLPPLDSQQQIVAILDSLQSKIQLNQKTNDNLQQQAQALFKQWFVDNPDAISWKEGTFSNLIEKTISGDWGKDSPSGNNTEMVYCIRGADIPEVRAGNKGKMPTRYILPKNYAVKQLVDGDIVVEISGGSPTQSTGRAAAVSDALLARYDKGMVCTNFCKALKPRAGYSMYVYYYWQYLYDRDIFFSYENGTTGIKNLDINGFIETEPIVIAPEGLVEKFDAVCQTVFSKIYANGMENEHLALVRDTLLPKLMSGEIDASAVQL